MLGWDDDFHSQVICPSEDNVSIMCSNLPGGMFKYCVLIYLVVCLNSEIMYVFWTIRFLIRNIYKISYLKGLQRTTGAGPGALASELCIITLRLPPNTFLFLWLQNKIHFANVVGTQKQQAF